MQVYTQRMDAQTSLQKNASYNKFQSGFSMQKNVFTYMNPSRFSIPLDNLFLNKDLPFTAIDNLQLQFTNISDEFFTTGAFTFSKEIEKRTMPLGLLNLKRKVIRRLRL